MCRTSVAGRRREVPTARSVLSARRRQLQGPSRSARSERAGDRSLRVDHAVEARAGFACPDDGVEIGSINLGWHVVHDVEAIHGTALYDTSRGSATPIRVLTYQRPARFSIGQSSSYLCGRCCVRLILDDFSGHCAIGARPTVVIVPSTAQPVVFERVGHQPAPKRVAATTAT